jgi:hypothetical protein
MFKPKRADGYSLRDIVVNLMKDKPPDTVIPYSDLMQVLETNDPNIVRTTALAANKVLLKQHQRGIKNVRNVGYRILRANEHMLAANGHQTKAERQMVKAINFFDGTNLAEMTEVERKLHLGQHMLAQATLAGFQHLTKRIDRIEALLKGTVTVNNV